MYDFLKIKINYKKKYNVTGGSTMCVCLCVCVWGGGGGGRGEGVMVLCGGDTIKEHQFPPSHQTPS